MHKLVRTLCLIGTMISCNAPRIDHESLGSGHGGSSVNRVWQAKPVSPAQVKILAAKLAGRSKNQGLPYANDRRNHFRTELFALIDEESGIHPAQTEEIVNKVVSGEMGLCNRENCTDTTGLLPTEVDNFLKDSEEFLLTRQPQSLAKRFIFTNSLIDSHPLQKVITARESVGIKNYYNLTVGEAYEQISKENYDYLFQKVSRKGLSEKEKTIMKFLEDHMPVFIYHDTNNEKAKAIFTGKALISPKEGNLPKSETRLQEPEEALFSSSEYVFFRMSIMPPESGFIRSYGDIQLYLKTDQKSLEDMTKIGVWGTPLSGNAFLQKQTGVNMPVALFGDPDPKEIERVLKIYTKAGQDQRVRTEFSKTLVTPKDYKRTVALKTVEAMRSITDVYLKTDEILAEIKKISTIQEKRRLAASVIQSYLQTKCVFDGDLEMHFPRRVQLHWLKAVGFPEGGYFPSPLRSKSKTHQELENMIPLDLQKNVFYYGSKHGVPLYDDRTKDILLK